MLVEVRTQEELAERERERGEGLKWRRERKKYPKACEFCFEVGPTNGNKIVLSYNSNSSKQPKRWI